jgi:hypothetical protein
MAVSFCVNFNADIAVRLTTPLRRDGEVRPVTARRPFPLNFSGLRLTRPEQLLPPNLTILT